MLTAGLVVGGNVGSGGAIVQGVRSTSRCRRKTFQGGELTIWGAAGANTQVLDCTFDGQPDVPIGLHAVQPGRAWSRSASPSRTSPTRAIRASNNRPFRTGARPRDQHHHRHLGRRRHAARPRRLERDGGGGHLDRPTCRERRAPDQDPQRLLVGDRDRQQRVEHHVHRSRHRHERADVVAASASTSSTSAGTTGFTASHVAASSRVSRPSGTTRPGAASPPAQTTIENGVIDASGWTTAATPPGSSSTRAATPSTINGVAFKNQNYAGIDAFNIAGQNNFGGNTYQLAAGAVQQSSSHM